MTGSIIALGNSFQGVDVVDVGEVLAQVSVGFFEIESAALAYGTVMSDTGFPGFSTSFVGIGFRAPSVYCSGTVNSSG